MERPAASDDRFDELVGIHRQRLVGMLLRRTGDPEAAEDLAQETLIRAYRNLHQLDPARAVWPWLRAIALNRASSWARRRRAVAPIDGLDVAAETSELRLVETRVDLDALMQGLTHSQRRALWLRYVEDEDPRRAAARLGLSAAAFKQLLHRARARLRAEIEQLGRSALLPGVVGVRWVRRSAGRMVRSDARLVQRLSESLAPLATAAVALMFVAGPTGGARAGIADAGPHVSTASLSGAVTVASLRSTASAPSDEPMRAGVAQSGISAKAAATATTTKRACAQRSACIYGAPAPSVADRTPQSRARPATVAQVDIHLVGDVCAAGGCPVADPSSEGPGPGQDVVDDLLRQPHIAPRT